MDDISANDISHSFLVYIQLKSLFPCRFRSSFYTFWFLQILKAPDRELNAWCSLKKAVQHRSDQEEMYDMRAYKQKAALHDIKKKILPSLTKPAEDPSETATEEPAKKKRRRKKNKRATGNSDGKSTTTESKVNEKATETSVKKPEKTSKKAEKDVEKKSSNQESMTNEKTLDATSTGNSDTVQKKKRRKRNKEVKASETTETKKETGEPPAKKTKTSDYEGFLKTLPSAKISDARLEAYGQNPKRFRQKQKYVLLAKQRKPVDGT